MAKAVRGDSWQRAWIIADASGTPVNLTGASARLHVRDASGAKVAEASTTDSRLAFDALAGRIDLVMPATAMAALPLGSYRFDLEVTFSNGIVKTYEHGGVLTVHEDQSRD